MIDGLERDRLRSLIPSELWEYFRDWVRDSQIDEAELNRWDSRSHDVEKRFLEEAVDGDWASAEQKAMCQAVLDAEGYSWLTRRMERLADGAEANVSWPFS